MFKNKKMLFVVIAIVIVLCILIVAINIYNQKKKEQFIQLETERVRQYSRINDFQKIEEVFYYLDTELISSERSDIENVDYLIKAHLKYDAEYEYKSYYDKLIQYSAYVLKYKNFYIKDDNKNINIFVLCNSEKQTVTTYFINDNEKYFEKVDSEDDMKQFKKSEVISVETVSKQLNQLISNNWNTSNTDFGTKDSYYRNYDIYFDEGLEVRKVNGKVFNIIFTNKYPDEIIKGIKVGITKQNTEKILGKPEFDSDDVWGYKTEKYYIFFSKEQISVYPVVKYDSDKMIEVINKSRETNDFQSYINDVRTVWNDYDSFESTGNKTIIKYTLKGIIFKYDSTAKSGIVLYNNYDGKVTENRGLEDFVKNNDTLPDKMYFKNLNLVYEHEKVRISTLDDYSKSGNFSNSSVMNISNNYKIVDNSNGTARFVSIDRKAPNTELRESFTYGIWYDDNNFIYSITGKGIYMFDVVNQKYSTIKEGSEDFRIFGIENNSTLIYDETQLPVGSH